MWVNGEYSDHVTIWVKSLCTLHSRTQRAEKNGNKFRNKFFLIPVNEFEIKKTRKRKLAGREQNPVAKKIRVENIDKILAEKRAEDIAENIGEKLPEPDLHNTFTFTALKEQTPIEIMSAGREQVPAAKKTRIENIVKILAEKRADDLAENIGEKLPEPNLHNTFSVTALKEQTPTEIIVRPDILSVPSTEDSLYNFLMSLYSSMNDLDPIRKINVQARIYSMLSQEVTAAAAGAKEWNTQPLIFVKRFTPLWCIYFLIE